MNRNSIAALLTHLGYDPEDVGETFEVAACPPGQPELNEHLTYHELYSHLATSPAILDPEWSTGLCESPWGETLEFCIQPA